MSLFRFFSKSKVINSEHLKIDISFLEWIKKTTGTVGIDVYLIGKEFRVRFIEISENGKLERDPYYFLLKQDDYKT